MPEPSLELLQSMMQRALDQLGLLREDVSNLRRRMSRVEHGVNVLTREQINASEAELARQDEIDRLQDRFNALDRKR